MGIMKVNAGSAIPLARLIVGRSFHSSCYVYKLRIIVILLQLIVYLNIVSFHVHDYVI